MPKRRTRKQKVGAKRQFLLSWEPAQNEPISNTVKGQFKNDKITTNLVVDNKKNANNLEKDEQLASVKRDITKSLILVSLVLCLELVLYFVWL
jgi:hypothetical protein